VFFCTFVWPNQTLVGGFSVNNLSQQVRLFALSVNRHSVLLNVGMNPNDEVPLGMRG